MSGKNTAVFGIYPSYANVESGVDGLKAAGFSNRDISVLFPEGAAPRDFSYDKSTNAPEGAAAGAGTGVVLGGVMGWLVGVGALAIPGVGRLIVAGPIMAAPAGAGVGRAVGGIAGALVGMGIPEHEANRFEGRIRDGCILLSVHSASVDWTAHAKTILEETGAQDISWTGEASSGRKKADEAASDEDLRRAS